MFGDPVGLMTTWRLRSPLDRELEAYRKVSVQVVRFRDNKVSPALGGVLLSFHQEELTERRKRMDLRLTKSEAAKLRDQMNKLDLS